MYDKVATLAKKFKVLIRLIEDILVANLKNYFDCVLFLNGASHELEEVYKNVIMGNMGKEGIKLVTKMPYDF